MKTYLTSLRWTRPSRATRNRLFVLAVLLLGGQTALPQCQPMPCTDFWLVDGPVNAIVINDETVYVGGQFSYIGPQTGPVVTFELGSAALMGSFPRVNGRILAVESDGIGGWFIGGQFTAAGGTQITNLAHVLPNLQLDGGWRPAIQGNVVNALVLHENVLYFGGQFQRIDGVVRQNLAAVSPTDGSLLPWNPEVGGTVNVLAAGNGLLYVGGAFYTIGSVPRAYLGAVDLVTGTASDWSPNADQQVLAIQVTSGTIYVGGQFTSIGGKPRNRLAALDATTGQASNWNPNPNGVVHALAVTDDAVLVGGDFTTISVQNRRGFAGVNRGNGAALPINLAIEGQGAAYNLVRAIRVAGNTIVLGGSFVRVQGQRRPLLAAADLVTGEPVESIPMGTEYNGPYNDAMVAALAVSGQRVVAAGAFQSIGGLGRNSAAALSARTGRVLPWSVEPSSPVLAMAAGSNSVYIAGGFTNFNNKPATGFVAVDGISGETLARWEFAATNSYADVVIRSLLLTETDLYAGGQFVGVGDQNVRLLTRLNPATGRPLEFDAKLGGGSLVNALAKSDETLYVAGDFNTVGGQPRSRLAAIQAAEGAVLDWNPMPNREVNTLRVAGDRLYVGGGFTRIADVDLRNLAAFEVPSHSILPFDAALGPNAYAVFAIDALDTSVYVAGQFDSIGGEFRRNAALLSLFTGQAVEWNPEPDQPPTVLALSDRWVCLGGAFRNLGAAPNSRPLGYFAVYSRAPLVLRSARSGAKFVLETTTGDRNYSVLQASSDMKSWSRVATNDLPGFTWTVERPIQAQPKEFYRVLAE